MLTPQDIQSKKFEKATFGGYDMSTVDDFLERVFTDYSALYKENAILKGKLKVLVEKVEEYRATEDSMRMALLTAQKMGNEIVENAKVRGDAILADINEQAKQRTIELRQALVMEEARLKEAERKTSQFSARVLDLIAEEQAFLEQLKELAIPIPAPVASPDPAILEQAKAIVTPIPVQVSEAGEVVVPVVPVVTETPDFVLDDKLEANVGAYLAEEVSRMAENFTEDEDRSPFVEDVTAQVRLARDPFDEQPTPAEEVNFLKMFDRDVSPTPPSIQTDDRAAEKIDITRSISSALGDKEELEINTDMFWDDESSPTTKRPKFEFNNLQFGTNLDEDDE
ncbi:MAG: DivIVA domain-containing protein [Oscillospiraceae bacterium]|nr:DivIVA domain-containing protein [Oscillospiraceae bacterium]